MSGSVKRIEALSSGVYDFVVLSGSAARVHLEEHPELAICTELTGTQYCREYMLYFTDPSKKEIEDGMRIGVDPVCMDQKVLTDILCEGKDVEIVEFPFIGFGDVIRRGRIDCAVFRTIGPEQELERLNLNCVPLEGIEGFEKEKTNTPVVVVRKDNYGIDRLIKKYLDTEKAGTIQREVLDGCRAMKFY